MGFYSRAVFPRLMNCALSGEKVDRLREEALRQARGDVLEVGFGTGLNLPHYPGNVTRIIGVEPNPGMDRIAAQPLALARDRMEVEVRHAHAEALPFDAERFDTVVSTMTLCSVDDIHQSLVEMRRVLKLAGRLLILEHGLAPDSSVQKWQHRLTGLWRVMACGCRLDRDIAAAIRSAGFEFDSLRNFYLEGEPRFASFMSLASALPLPTARAA
ncbi:MAG TPA: class I SAM-dependent methyltransferase [Polyangiaceae bacterium]